MKSRFGQRLEPLRARLQEVPVFAAMSEDLRQRVAMVLLWCGELEDCTAGRLLFVEGERDDSHGCILLDGKVEVLKREGPTKRLFAPELMGEMHLFGVDFARTATVKTLGQVTVLRFSWDEVRTMAEAVLRPSEMDDLVLALSARAHARLEELYVSPASEE